jgi:predicted RNA-binding Zn ribbon-like protein
VTSTDRAGALSPETLLELLNSTPVQDGGPVDLFADPDHAAAWPKAHGGSGSPDERTTLLRARDLLQAVLRGQRSPADLAPLLDGVHDEPVATADGLDWQLRVPADRELAVGAVLAWDELRRRSPGRLRPCSNPECQLFLLDRSKANRGRWCSMAVCGNRMKARRHYQRERQAGQE